MSDRVSGTQIVGFLMQRLIFFPQISTDRTLAWHATVDLLVPSSIQVTFEWEPIYDQALYDFGVTRKYQVVGYLQLVAEMIKENMGLPIKDKKFIITGLVCKILKLVLENEQTKVSYGERGSLIVGIGLQIERFLVQSLHWAPVVSFSKTH